MTLLASRFWTAIRRFPELADPASTCFSMAPKVSVASLRDPPRKRKPVCRLWLQLHRHQSSGGAGKVLAQWMQDGQPPMDLWDVDVRRTFPFQSEPSFLRERTTETLGLLSICIGPIASTRRSQ